MVDREKLVFAPCDIMLPPYAADDSAAWEKWAVIACDQHTSDKEYWKNCEKITEGFPSSYDLILPEAYLGTENETSHRIKIDCAQKSMNSGWLRRYKHSMVYVERTLSNGKTRRGIVGKIDLEHYDFSKDSASAVRPTEGTVPERVAPRVEIRKNADFELPHIMVFMNDSGFDITAECAKRRCRMKKLYDFDLMLGGGKIVGYLITGDVLEEILKIIFSFETAKSESGEMMYGVGDGNHSLATAKTIYAQMKEKNGALAMSSKARYAAVEMVSIDDGAVEFEPIYRLMENVDADNFINELTHYAEDTFAFYPSRRITLITNDKEINLNIPVPENRLTVEVLQRFIDVYTKQHPDTVVDYIHGSEAVKSSAAKANCVGILYDGMKKNELFPYVTENGPLPKKTFSMGSADTKRYYLEVRRIVAE